MKIYQLKTPSTVSVIGMTFEGDYIVLSSVANGLDEVQVQAKADFEAKYEEAAKVQVPEEPKHDTAPVAQTTQAVPNEQHLV